MPENAPGKLTTSFVASCHQDCLAAGFHFSEEVIRRFAASALSKRFVILTGLSGSGKTKLAQAFARWLTPNRIGSFDPFIPGAEIPSDRIKYIVNAADRLAVEFWNSTTESEAIKVVLPRALIREWVDYIQSHGLTADASARQIREGVSNTTSYSTQLNSFETHLKAAAFAEINAAMSEKSHKCYEVVAVGADWTSNEHVLGYLDGLDSARYVKTRVLDLIIRATREPELPHFLILDEMNLSHVERYFADMLSAIESGEPLHLHSAIDSEGNRATPSGIPGEIQLPPNLIIVGTVNIDETTYMFSPKVLDRANVIEFRVSEEEMTQFLTKSLPAKLQLLDGAGVSFAKGFVQASASPTTSIGDNVQLLETELLLFFGLLKQCNAEFGYRTAKEISAFIGYHKLIAAPDWEFRDAFDAQVAQKLLPKLHGSRAKLEPILCALGILCFVDRKPNASAGISADRSLSEMASRAMTLEDDSLDPLGVNPDGTCSFKPSEAYYPISFEKLTRMLHLVRSNGFTSFAEA